MSNGIYRARMALRGLTLLSYVVVFALTAAVGLQLDYRATCQMILWIGATGIFASAYCTWRNMQKFRNAVETTFLGVLLTFPVIVATYLSMRMNMPLVDAQLAALDSGLGFDWTAFVGFVDARPWLATGLDIAYRSFATQLLGLPLLLCFCGRAERAYRMVAGYALICLSASVIAVWFPAIGAYPHFGVTADQLRSINIHFGYFFLDQFEGVRNDPDFVLSIAGAAGILTFPSVHAGAATLCAWAGWEIRAIRYPVLVLNIGMAIGAISHGSHYFVDIPAGILLAIVCIRLVRVAIPGGKPVHAATAALPA